MTELQLYESALIEQNKLESPTLLIEDYNYLINKAILQYINLTYARFDVNQQASDDLRWLQKSIELDIRKQNKMIHPGEEANYACVLPSDYLHMLGCSVHFSSKCCKKDSNCKPTNDDGMGGKFSVCRRLTANQFPAILQNAYFKPSYKNPYYYITKSGNVGLLNAYNEVNNILDPCGLDDCIPIHWKDEVNHVLKPCDDIKETTIKSGNIMEIRCGKNSMYFPDVAYVDYLRKPKEIKLTWEDINSAVDKTDSCEFPDAVAYEIINIFVRLLMENASDERLKTFLAINQTVSGTQVSESK